MHPKPTDKKSLDVLSLCLAFLFATTGCDPSLDDLDDLGIRHPGGGGTTDLGPSPKPLTPTPTIQGDAGSLVDTGGAAAPKVSVHVVPDAGSQCSRGGTVADAGIAEPTPMLPPADPQPPPVEPAAPSASPKPGDLRITEVMVNPAGQDAGFEWFEILNTTDQTLDLTGLVVADNARESAVTVSTIAPGELMVFAQRLLVSGEGVIGTIAYGTAVSFNNDGDSLSLCIGPCATGTVLTRATWGNLGSRYDGRAAQFNEAGMPECPAEPAIPTGGFGTPGQVNPPCAP